MACNYLTQRNTVIDIKNSDTLSEISDNGTATSDYNSNWGSREDLRDFITKHGLKDVTDLYQDRFKVDRRKLEQMLSGDNEALIPADVFFSKIMEDTDTYITWPNKLKLGAKSKKDPNVRIAGKQENVEAAKERIMAILFTRCNRVTMKMDISYTDHSHIIGKGGLSIKRVMEETQCHVHFPDSNRSNSIEKSNQVSISGDLDGVECARSRVRELIPLIFGFEPPIMSQNIDNTTPYVIKIQEQYKVQVMFKTRSKLHATIVLVKGVEWEAQQVKRATCLLMDYICGELVNQIPVQMSIQISPQHHQIVLGKTHSNLKAIMQYTNCQIMFPDAQDQNIPNLKKNNINISGNIHDVYKARQLLIGSLPLVIIFDLPEDTINLRTRPEQIAEIQASCNVSINIRQKTKQVIKSCIIKGIEREAENIYKARNLVLGIDEPPISADIPNSYHIPNMSQTQVPYQQNELLPPQPVNLNQSPISPLMFSSPSSLWHYPNANLGQSAPFVGMAQKPPFLYNVLQQSTASSGYHSLGASSLEQTRENSLFSTNNSFTSFLPSPRNSTSPKFYRHFRDTNLDNKMANYTNGNCQNGDNNKKGDNQLTPNAMENKRLAGLRAMQTRPTPNNFRYPTNSWSGYGISHTSPAGFVSADLTNRKDDDDVWKSPTNITECNEAYNNYQTIYNLNTSNILENAPSHVIDCVTSSTWSDLSELLNSLGLEKYIKVFMEHEIDLSTFSTLNNQDLIEIGINAFGSRRKMLLAISELNKRLRPFSASPGAERKKSPATTTSNSTTGNTLSASTTTSTPTKDPRETW